jgi:hypothetical protein
MLPDPEVGGMQATTPADALTLKDTFDILLKLVAYAGAVLVAVAGAIGFILKRMWDKRDKTRTELLIKQQQEQNEEIKMREMLFDSLRWFEGDTQKRSVGLAMVNAAWDKDSDFRHVWTNVLATQAIYLLLESKQVNREDEVANLYRVMEILQRPGARVDALTARQVRDALLRRLRNSTEKGVGPDTTDETVESTWRSQLEQWESHFRALAAPTNQPLQPTSGAPAPEAARGVGTESTNVRAEPGAAADPGHG